MKQRKWRVVCGGMTAIVDAYNPKEAFVVAVKKRNPKEISLLAEVTPVNSGEPPQYDIVRMAIQAPQMYRILRGEKYRNPPPHLRGK